VVQVVFFQVAGGRVVFDECVTVGEAIITTSEFGSADLWDATHTNISPSTLRERAGPMRLSPPRPEGRGR